MKLVSFVSAGRSSWGVVAGGGIVEMARRLDGRYPTLRAAIAGGVLGEVAREAENATPDCPLEDVRLLPPIPDPDKIICIGLNYKAHVGEGGGPLPEHPSLFTRYPDTLVAHEEEIVCPKLSKELDYECELAFVMGEGGRHIPREDALRRIAGYSCLNDGSVRDYQQHHSLPAGKNFFASGSFGPWLVTPDEIPDPGALSLRTLINGKELQHGNTRDLIFDIPAIIAYVSGFTPLSPGDVISTGTPEGVGFLRKPPVFVQSGDLVEIEIEGIGVLRNPVIAEA